MKREKYSNGGLQVKKDFKGVGSIEGSVSGSNSYQSANLRASTNAGGARVSANISKDSQGNTGRGLSVEKQLKDSAVGGYTNRGGSGVNYSRNVGSGFTVGASVDKPKNGSNRYFLNVSRKF